MEADTSVTNVLITGADGFIGRNLTAYLRPQANLRVLTFTRRNSSEDLIALLQQAHIVFHLAGVNRPQDDAEFETGNAQLTLQLVRILDTLGKAIPVVLGSSTQAAQNNNPYGQSKRLAEVAVFAYAERTGAPVYVYRLPNIFGKWSKPNYNSVVVTFCYNISRNLPIQINDPHQVLTLVYIDDLMMEFEAVLKSKAYVSDDGYYHVSRTFNISLQALADTVYAFRGNRQSAIVADMADPLTRFLYATYLSYLDEDDFAYVPDYKTDQRGWLFELIKSAPMGQIFVSQTKPGVTRGGHYHHTKVEKFVVLSGDALVRFRKVGGSEVTEYSVSGADVKIIDIPPGYAHDITNTGTIDLVTLFWASETFDPQNPDTYPMAVK